MRNVERTASPSGTTTRPSQNGGSPGGLRLARPPQHAFLRRLADVLLPDFERELLQVMQLAVMFADGVSREQAAERMGLSRSAIDAACKRLERIAPQLERSDDDGPTGAVRVTTNRPPGRAPVRRRYGRL